MANHLLEKIGRVPADVRALFARDGDWKPTDTGGGCFVWQRTLSNGFTVSICDEQSGLGDAVDETYSVVLSDAEGAPIDDRETSNLADALAVVKVMVAKV